MVDDPGDYLPPAEAEAKRADLFDLLERLVQWDSNHDPAVIEAAKREIRASTKGTAPIVVDPFCGSGAIPIEASRLGVETIGSDLNPIAVAISKALVEVPHVVARHPPIAPQGSINKRLLDIPGFDGFRSDLVFYADRVIAHARQDVASLGQTPSGGEITLRSRSLLFVALGIYGASAIGPDTPLLLPENGTIALNFPLTPSRRGSCSTRTAHPHHLKMLERALRCVGIANNIVNPLGGKTKGEVVHDCANPDLLARLAPLTVSCAKRSRRGHWKRTTARSCGQCMPCIYRRAALHLARRDDEVYGNDVCSGEVEVSGDDDAGRDFRACLSLLRRNPSAQEIANTLMASGPLDVSSLMDHASLVQRAMNEIRTLLRAKGTATIQHAAGVAR